MDLGLSLFVVPMDWLLIHTKICTLAFFTQASFDKLSDYVIIIFFKLLAKFTCGGKKSKQYCRQVRKRTWSQERIVSENMSHK